jgi:uncharacterized Zn finger protein
MEMPFTCNENDLKQIFEVLQEEEIQECCSSQVYYRGLQYYENGNVNGAKFNSDKTLLTTKVRGSKVYAVQLSLKNRKVEASCTCHQDIVCKHVVATMLYATLENIDTESFIVNASLDIKEYLNNQPKGELVDLILKYASDELFTMIRNEHSGISEAQKIFNNCKRSLEDMFNDEELSNDPDAFEESLIKVIKNLSGLETKISKKLVDLVFYIIRKVETATDEGYLYNHYSDYHFDPPEQFYEFLARLANVMDFHEKTQFIEQLDAAINKSSYSTFEGIYKWIDKFFKECEVVQLKNLLVNEYNDLPEVIVESYYSKVSSILSDNDKENILDVLAGRDDSRAVELAELLSKNGKPKKSILMLRRLIFGNPNRYVDDALFFLYLDQMKAEKLDLHDAILKCLNQCPNESMLRRVLELLPSAAAVCEAILEKQRPEELLNYLESTNRADDALSLTKRSKVIQHRRVFTFYKKNKKKFPEDAKKYFSQVINENLKNTGDLYYRTIADALNHLKQIDKESVHEMALHLRQNYNRRSRLMTLISEF